MKFEIKNRFTNAIIFSLECKTLKICLEAAITEKADLSGADLSGADLRGADLSGADHAAQIGQPNGWNAFCYFDEKSKKIRVQVGCKNMAIVEGRQYWKGKENRREVLAALDYAEVIGKTRKWGEA